jgi:hypothetical protein
VRKLSEYREHAAECRKMALSALPAHKEQLENMAVTWDQLAEARERQLAKQGITEEQDEEPVRGSD